jgi:hypothetical protein
MKTLLAIIILAVYLTPLSSHARDNQGGGGWYMYKAVVQIFDQNNHAVPVNMVCEIGDKSGIRNAEAIDLKNCFRLEPEFFGDDQLTQ